MRATRNRLITNRSKGLSGTAARLLLTLTLTLAHGISSAEDTAHCGNSTVEDAWGPDVASQAERFLGTLQSFVRAKDRAGVASLVHYPIRILNGDHSYEISSSSEFVKKYSSIMTPNVKRAISSQAKECLFANGQGMMVGKGQLWFQREPSGDMKVITINLSAPGSSP